MRYRHLIAGLVIGLLAASALPAGAGNGDMLIIGDHNSAQKGTFLVSSRGARTLKLVNADADGDGAATALELDVPRGFPPMVVNSTVKVSKLNADLLDGRNSTSFAGSDEGLMGDHYELAADTTLTIVADGSWQVDMTCTFVPGPGAPPNSMRLDFEVTNTDQVNGVLSYLAWDGTGWEYMSPGELESWSLLSAYGLNIAEILILAVNDNGSKVRLEGVGWADYDGCYAALQVVPWPEVTP